MINVFTGDFATPYLNKLRTQLIHLLCYRSSYSHDAEAINDIAKRLSTEKQYKLLLGSIKESIPTPKLNDPTWAQADFSLLFRNHRLLRTLGSSLQLQSFGDARDEIPLVLNIGAVGEEFLMVPEIEKKDQKSELQVQFHLELLNCYHELQLATSLDRISTRVSDRGGVDLGSPVCVKLI